jgi:hypothetical protein
MHLRKDVPPIDFQESMADLVISMRLKLNLGSEGAAFRNSSVEFGCEGVEFALYADQSLFCVGSFVQEVAASSVAID